MNAAVAPTNARRNILVCASDAAVLAAACDALSDEELDVTCVLSLAALRRHARRARPDAVVLRIDSDGDAVAMMRQIRATTRAPTLILAPSSAHETAIDLLDLGASDYLCRDIRGGDPQALRELRARVTRTLRDFARPLSDEIALGDVLIDRQSHRVTRQGVPVVLTDTEHRLLQFLVERLDEIVPHEEILATLWGEEHRSRNDYLRTYIKRLRNKLGWASGERLGPHIRAVRGVGYGLFVSGLDRARTVQDEG